MRNIIIRNLTLLTIAGFCVGGFVGCTKSATKKTDLSEPAARNWASDMQGMAKILEQLMPYVFSRSEFHSSVNQERVSRLIADYARNVNLVETHVGEKILGDDPMVKYNLNRLKQATEQAREAHKEGNIEYSRNVLAESVGACFSCHSTNQLGPERGFSTA